MRLFARAYAAAAAVLVLVAVLTATSAAWNALPWAAGGLLGALAVGVGIRAHRPAGRGFWLGVAAADVLWGIAGIVTLAGVGPVSSSYFVGAASLYLPGYAGLAIAMVSVLRTARSSRPAPLDAAIGIFISTAAVWPLTVHLLHEGKNTAEAIDGSLFPALDVALSLLLLRIVVTPSFRIRALRRLTLAVTLMTVADFAYASLLFTSPLAARLSSVAYTVVYLLLGAAALPRSMRQIPPAALPDDIGPNRRTLPVLGVALSIVPAILFAQELYVDDTEGAAIAGLALAAVALVVPRVSTLLRNLNDLRQRAEDSERLFRMVFDSAGVGISVGRNGWLERTNPALQRMLGYSAEELAERHFTELLHPDDAAIRPVPQPGRAFTFERRYVRKNGELVWAEVTLTAPEDNSFGIAVIEDVTASKQLGEDLRHAQKMEAVGQLAGGVAHDFNNLMTAVIGYASLLRRELDAGDARRERVDAISAAAERAAELTRKLLAFSRRQVLRLEPADLSAIVRELDPIVARLLPTNIVVDHRLTPGAIARVDRAEIDQVLLNLCLNARDAMPDGGVMTVTVRIRGQFVELAVTDTGIGMSEETRSRIFDPFFTTKPLGQGTGLGLATVDGIVGQLGGTIEVTSAPNVGSTFTVRLPLDPSATVPAATAGRPADEGADADGTILLVEDEEVVRLVTTEMLTLSGYAVVCAASGEEALTLLAAGARPDVLVSDVVMTGIDGPALVQAAREIVPDLPVLFVSGYSADTLGMRSAEHVLMKPFTSVEIREAVEHVRRTPAPV